MLHIFDQKEFEPQPDRKQTLNRLQNVLGAERRPGSDGPPAPGAAATVTVSPVEKAPGTPPAWARKQVQNRPEPPRTQPPPLPPTPVPVARQEPLPAVSGSPEFQQFAEQFMRSFLGGLSGAVKEINSLVSEDRRKLEEVFDFFARTSREVESVRGDIAALARTVETFAKSQDELATRIAKADEAIRSLGNISDGREQVQQLDRRLELQAGVIRTLHNAVHAREERLERLLGAFQGLHALAAEPAGSRRPALPEEM
jgi:ribosomal protein S6